MKTIVVRNLLVKPFMAVLLYCVVAVAWAAGVVNINSADAQTLATELKGIGARKAEAIVAYRAEHGPFKSIDAITDVKGIGDKFLDDNAGRLAIEDK